MMSARMMWTRRVTWTLAVLLALLLVLSACGKGRGGLRFAVTADGILGEYRDNRAAAEAKYLDQTGKIAGQLGYLEPRERGRAILRLTGRETLGEFVSCMFTGEEALATLSGLSAGQEVIVIGKVLTYDTRYGGRLADCTLDLEIAGKADEQKETDPEMENRLESLPEREPEVVVLPQRRLEPEPEPEPPYVTSFWDEEEGDEEQGETYQEIAAVIDAWTRAHNDKDMRLFSSLYADRVDFYTAKQSRAECVKVKQQLLSTKYADFYQETYDLSLSQINPSQVRAAFLKVTYSEGVSSTYESWLVLDNQSGRWQIVKEK